MAWNWLKSFTLVAKKHPIRGRRQPQPYRPIVEILEARALPASLTVNTFADEFNGCDVGKCSLREAIQEANTNGDANDLILLRAGVYKITRDALDDDNASGDFDIVAEDLSADNQVTIRGVGKGKTFIDGKKLDRVFDIFGGSDSLAVHFEKLTIRNGDTADEGGGIRSNDQSSVSLNLTRVTGNHAVDDGGGISADGNLSLLNSTIDRNTSDADGGGIAMIGTTLTIYKSTLDNNSALDGNGGALYFEALGLNADDAGSSIINSTIGQNKADNGAGLYANGVGDLTIVHATIALNAANDIGGGMVVDESYEGILQMGNTIVAKNKDFQADPQGVGLVGVAPDIFDDAGIVSLFGNLIGVNDGSFFAENQLADYNPADDEDLVGNSDHPINPRLKPLGELSGQTRTFGLNPNSPARKNANADVSLGFLTVLEDQRGRPRPKNVQFDIGAIEV